MLNIMNLTTGMVMLTDDVETWISAQSCLDYYRSVYSKGMPYPNGQGVYTGEFVICRRCEGCGTYHVIQ